MKKPAITIFVLLLGAIFVWAINGVGNLTIHKRTSSAEVKFKDGDLIFQSNPSGQGLAIQQATKSKYTHCGIIFIEDGKPVIYHAVQPVKKSTLEGFAAMGTNGEYWIKRVKNRDAELSADEIAKMKTEASAMIGKNYDIYFNWGDDEIYCSEFIWKVYKRGANLEIGPLKAMKEFDLSGKVVKEIMARRYGKNIPLEEKMVAPGDIFNSSQLESVTK